MARGKSAKRAPTQRRTDVQILMDVTTQSKRCTKCRKRKTLTDFHVNRTKSDERQSSCKRCACALTKAHYVYNPKLHKARNDKWRRANPVAKIALSSLSKARERWRKYGFVGSVTPPDFSISSTYPIVALMLQLRLRFPSAGYQLHHPLPLRDGGKHSAGNLTIISAEDHRRVTAYEAVARLTQRAAA